MIGSYDLEEGSVNEEEIEEEVRASSFIKVKRVEEHMAGHRRLLHLTL